MALCRIPVNLEKIGFCDEICKKNVNGKKKINAKSVISM